MCVCVCVRHWSSCTLLTCSAFPLSFVRPYPYDIPIRMRACACAWEVGVARAQRQVQLRSHLSIISSTLRRCASLLCCVTCCLSCGLTRGALGCRRGNKERWEEEAVGLEQERRKWERKGTHAPVVRRDGYTHWFARRLLTTSSRRSCGLHELYLPQTGESTSLSFSLYFSRCDVFFEDFRRTSRRRVSSSRAAVPLSLVYTCPTRLSLPAWTQQPRSSWESQFPARPRRAKRLSNLNSVVSGARERKRERRVLDPSIFLTSRSFFFSRLRFLTAKNTVFSTGRWHTDQRARARTLRLFRPPAPGPFSIFVLSCAREGLSRDHENAHNESFADVSFAPSFFAIVFLFPPAKKNPPQKNASVWIDTACVCRSVCTQISHTHTHTYTLARASIDLFTIVRLNEIRKHAEIDNARPDAGV